MGAALLMGLLSSGEFDAADVAIVEPLAERRTILTDAVPRCARADVIPACDGAVLAVKPPDVPRRRPRGGCRRRTAAAVDRRRGDDGDHRRRRRTVDGRGAGDAQHAGARRQGRVGDHRRTRRRRRRPRVGGADPRLGRHDVRAPEAQFDAVTGLTGSGPAYVFFVAEALIEAGAAAGLDPALVESMVAQLLVGSAALLAAQGDPASLRAMVTSPGGTTAAGIAVLEDRGRPIGLRRCRARCGGTQPGAGTHRVVTGSRRSA